MRGNEPKLTEDPRYQNEPLSGGDERPFRPSWWCPGHHLQTIYAYFFRPHEKFDLYRQRLELSDGDFIDIDFLSGNTEAPLVLVLHGLEGSSSKTYIRGFLTTLRKIGWRACVMNYRGCSGEPNRLKTSYHCGKTDDIGVVVDKLFEMEGGRKIMMVGFSVGGSMLLKWLGEQGAAAAQKIQRAVAVSAPYDFIKAVHVMDRGFAKEIYTRKLLFTLRRKALAKLKRFPGLINGWKVWFANTFRVFDAEVTAPIHGFKSVDEYWDQASCMRYLKDVRVETGLIHSNDDPFFPGHFFPHEEVRRSEFLKKIWTRYGGHMGFVQGSWPWKQDEWLQNTVIDFLSGNI